jgi:hypothetical protein
MELENNGMVPTILTRGIMGYRPPPHHSMNLGGTCAHSGILIPFLRFDPFPYDISQKKTDIYGFPFVLSKKYPLVPRKQECGPVCIVGGDWMFNFKGKIFICSWESNKIGHFPFFSS